MQQRHGHGGPGGPHRHTGGRPRGQEPDIDPLLKPPPQRFQYFTGTDPKGRPIPRPELLDEEAEEKARTFGPIPASQLRRFYGAVTSLKRQLEIDRDFPDEALRARLVLLKAHAAYARKRVKNMPDEFVRFFVRHADAVRTRSDFLSGFVPHFEAIIAYHKMYEKKERD